MWKSTLEVGCAAVNCGFTEDYKVRRGEDGTERAQGWYVVCEYILAGNVVGRHDEYFKLNVMPRNMSQTLQTSQTTSITATTTAPTSQPSEGATGKTGTDSTLRMMVLALGTVGIGMSLYT